jgi:hemolysin D
MQRRRAVKVEAARKALETSREQTRAEYARGIVNDLAEAEQKAAQTAQGLIKAEIVRRQSRQRREPQVEWAA